MRPEWLTGRPTAYVALSRAVGMATLELVDFDPGRSVCLNDW